MLQWLRRLWKPVHATSSAATFDLQGLNQELPAIQEAGDEFLQALGPMVGDHVGNSIAAAAAVAGATLLRATGSDLAGLKPGTVVLADIHESEGNLFKFAELAARHLGLGRRRWWASSLPSGYRPQYDVAALVGIAQAGFDEICSKYPIRREFHSFVAVYAAVRIVHASHNLGFFDHSAGRDLIGEYIVAGARTVPDR